MGAELLHLSICAVSRECLTSESQPRSLALSVRTRGHGPGSSTAFQRQRDDHSRRSAGPVKPHATRPHGHADRLGRPFDRTIVRGGVGPFRQVRGPIRTPARRFLSPRTEGGVDSHSEWSISCMGIQEGLHTGPREGEMPARDRQHYLGSYDARARHVRRQANADPSTRCWRCGLTLEEEQARKPGKRVTWHAGHVVDGDYLSHLRAEHSTCNTSAGARIGNRRRALNLSERWH